MTWILVLALSVDTSPTPVAWYPSAVECEAARAHVVKVTAGDGVYARPWRAFCVPGNPLTIVPSVNKDRS